MIEKITINIHRLTEKFNNDAKNEKSEGDEYETDKEYVSGSEEKLEL